MGTVETTVALAISLGMVVYVMVVEVLDWAGRFKTMRDRFPRFVALAENRALRVGLLLLAILFQARAIYLETARVSALEVTRPFFSEKKFTIDNMKNAEGGFVGVLSLDLDLVNSQSNPARGMRGLVMVVDSRLGERPPLLNRPIDSVADFGRDATFGVHHPITTPPNNVSLYVFMSLIYEDALTKQLYRQEFYLKWSGVQNGVFVPTLMHVNTPEKDMIAEYLKKRGVQTQ